MTIVGTKHHIDSNGEQYAAWRIMQVHIEKELFLTNLSVHRGTISWDDVEETPPYPGYCLSQRLSDNHSPLRIGNLEAPSVMPRVRSVGLLPPGQSVRMLPVEQALQVIVCIFDKQFFESTTQTPQSHWDEHIDSIVSIRNQRIEILMQEIHAELEEPSFGNDLLIEAAGLMIVVELARHARELQRKKPEDGDRLTLSQWQLRCIQERVQASLQHGYPTLAELATLCGISQGHLARSFKAATGWSVHQFIAEERLKAAKLMLAEETLSCQEIATHLGFGSAAYFSTAFRRRTGKTPSEFRRQKAVRNSRYL